MSGDPEQELETASLATKADAPAAKQGRPSLVSIGQRVGRYRIQGDIGVGGMGIVLDAHDPELNRRVAIKMLLAGKRGGEAAQQRLLREAQALARVSHPNIVAVYDVGTTEAGIYVAMEYVSGPTLRVWADPKKRTAAEVLKVFTQAGRGLAAAHAAGLVHRDFKPANVIVGDDGRVRVLDFGLARAAHQNDPDADPRLDPALEMTPLPLRRGEDSGRVTPSRLESPITQHGAVVGTPRYMAPEQQRGQAVGPPADVFAFCVSLYEVLYARYPFGNGPDQQTRLLEGRLDEPPMLDGVPAHVQRVLLRGLAPDPERRPTMPELVRELERDRWRTARIVGISAAVVALSAGAAYAMIHAATPPCSDSQERLAPIWNDGARSTVHTRFSASVVHMLDEYAQRWAVKHREVCLATSVEHKQSEQLMDQRMACLDVRRTQLAALVQGLSDAKGATVEDALAAASSLLDVDGCDDVEHFGPTVALPAAPAEAREVAAIRADMAPITTQIGLGDVAAALPKAKAIAERADKTGFMPIRAQAADLVAYARLEAGDVDNIEPLLQQMVVLGSQAKNDQVVATGWIELMRLRGSAQAQTKDALALRFAAEAAVHRAGDPPKLQGDYYNALSDIYDIAADYPASRDAQERALEIVKRTRGPRHVLVGGALVNLGGTQFALGDYDRALAYFQEALAIYEEQVGPDSPRVAIALTNIAQVLTQKHRLAEAEPMLKRALAIKERTFGPEHRGVGITALGLSDLYVQEHRYDAALPLAQRSYKILSAALAPEHPHVATAQTSLGQILVRLGNYDEGCTLVDKAAPVLIKTYKVDGAAQTIAYQAECETHRGHPDAALALLAPAMAAVDASKDPWIAALLRLRSAEATGVKTPKGAALKKEADALFATSGVTAP